MGSSTPSDPLDFYTPQYCLTKEETDYVYESVNNDVPVQPVHIDRKVSNNVGVNINPYKQALTREVDEKLLVEPLMEMQKCDLTWSILSTSIDYTTNIGNCPYTEMNTSSVYRKLSVNEQLINEDSSDQWDERFDEVNCNLHYTHTFNDTNDVSTTYLGQYVSKDDPRMFPVDNHIPFDGRGMAPQ